jgi:membrane-associated protease RseP (regulator of RpoE activity)
MRRVLLLSALLAPVFAAEGSKPVEGPKPAPATTAAPQPFLGVRFDENSLQLDSEPGMPVNAVVPGSTAQSLGLQDGDRLLSINGKAVEKTDDLKTILGGSKVGDAISIEFIHAGQKTAANGTLAERPKPATVAREVERLNQKLSEVQELAAAKSREPTLGEILQQLKDIEAGLPRAVAAFKKQYPDGEFDIKIQVSITSDKHAKDPIVLSNSQALPDKPAETGEKKDDKKAEDKKADDKKDGDKDKKDAAKPETPPAPDAKK